ncbi:MAG: hypothetical protein CL742_07470 [Chloroflexi bacterium]|nr:hypothetical protein [Chloroflexota bacterium]|tara:strand:- start:1295 stop:1927 length:633 start_codon:yes stop_codon:yes gene_type:complete
MSYFLNTFRTPNPGKEAEVVEGVQKSMESLGVPGLVSVTISPPNAHLESTKVTAVVPIPDANGVDALMDAIFGNNMAALKERSGLSELSRQENMSLSRVRASNVVNSMEEFDPKYIMRRFFQPKMGKLQAFINLMSDWMADVDLNFAYSISTPVGGQITSVRITHITESFALMQELHDNIISDNRLSEQQSLIERPGVHSLGRITYSKRP